METALRKTEKYLTYRLGREEYGLGILKVREIVGLMDITPVPQAARHIRGVVNLRGKIVPVMDLRRKFGLPEAAAARENCIITVVVQGAQGDLLLGLLVDAVAEVVQVEEKDVEPVPSLGNDLPLDFVLGLAKVKERIIVLLDVDKVVLAQELEGLRALGRKIAEG